VQSNPRWLLGVLCQEDDDWLILRAYIRHAEVIGVKVFFSASFPFLIIKSQYIQYTGFNFKLDE
jgi:hypothetical protein